MTRICLLVEVDLAPVYGTFNTPTDARDRIEQLLNSRFSFYRPTVELTAHEPAHVESTPSKAQAAWDEYLATPVADLIPKASVEVDLDDPPQESIAEAWQNYLTISDDAVVYLVSTDSSQWRIVLEPDNTGTLMRLGGSNPYVPPDLSARSWDGEAFPFTNGRFEDTPVGGEWFTSDDCEISHTGVIRDKKVEGEAA